VAKILVVDDDPTVTHLVGLHLETAGHEVSTAADGEHALTLARAEHYDLVIADLSMPRMDGFALLEGLRATAATGLVPVICLSAMEGREPFRRAMNLGADDFLPKPVERAELLRAVSARISRARSLRTPEGRAHTEPLSPGGVSRFARTTANLTENCTILRLVLRHPAGVGDPLSALEREQAQAIWQSHLTHAIESEQGHVLRYLPQYGLACFDSLGPGHLTHAERAARAGLSLLLATEQVRIDLSERFGAHADPGVSIGVAIGACPVDGPNGRASDEAIAAIVEDLIQVERQVGPAGWSIAVDPDTLRAAGKGFLVGRAATFTLARDDRLRTLIEIAGFERSAGQFSSGSDVHLALHEAIAGNELRAYLAYPDAAGDAQHRLAHQPRSQNALPQVEGYSQLAMLGTGGMSKVYLARHDETGETRVLKMVPINTDEDMLQRFLQEYALIAQVRHPNVAQIYEQGFAEDGAYIAMEYLSGGDLGERIADGLGADEALHYLSQIALGLTAIHHRGIIHRDLKPENLMFRADGMLVVADFGIAKQVSTRLTHTQQGLVYGTPYYMSPEQARGWPVDARSDLYSLGIIFHEMLTGKRPYTASRPEAIIYQQIHSPVPRLPARLSHVQDVLDRLLAKQPVARFRSAVELLGALRSRVSVTLPPARGLAASPVGP
jgi:DNA-binding response OmpR family regulator